MPSVKISPLFRLPTQVGFNTALCTVQPNKHVQATLAMMNSSHTNTLNDSMQISNPNKTEMDSTSSCAVQRWQRTNMQKVHTHTTYTHQALWVCVLSMLQTNNNNETISDRNSKPENSVSANLLGGITPSLQAPPKYTELDIKTAPEYSLVY